MPEVFIDDRTFDLYRQCEIRRASGTDATSYYFDIVWIKADMVTKNGLLVSKADGTTWAIAEIFGSKRLPGTRTSWTT